MNMKYFKKVFFLVVSLIQTFSILGKVYAMDMESFKSYIDPKNHALNLNDRIQPLHISGYYRLVTGHLQGDKNVTWTRSNFDLNERNFRVLFGADKENTFDPRLFNQLSLNMETLGWEHFVFHSNLTFDPWSYTGKTDKITLTSEGGDKINIRPKYWSNTGMTLNEDVYTSLAGDVYHIPEISVSGGETTPTTINSVLASQNGFNNRITIPALKVRRTFQPLREFWVGWQNPDREFRFFPMAYENQAMSSNDPLQLSNRRLYWEPSPWTADWIPGNFNSTPQDFSRGRWSTDLAFVTRDSDGRRLTALRGFYMIDGKEDEDFFEASIASPKGLWQNFDEITAMPGALQKRFALTPDSNIGVLYNFRFGFVNKQQDAFGQNIALDGSFKIIPSLNLMVEGALSQSKQDQTTDFQRRSQGGAFHAKLQHDRSLLGGETKIDFSYTQMNKEFDPVLSLFRNTREDRFWSKHIYFHEPEENASGWDYPPLLPMSITWSEIKPFRLGDGIDTGRSVFRYHQESLFWNNNTGFLIDIRDVRNQSRDWIETVSRLEVDQRLFDNKLTIKGLLLSQRLPNTKKGIDPFVKNPITDEPVLNTSIPDNVDPSVHHFSGGLEYKVLEWLAVNWSYERTNDIGNYPRELLQETSFVTEIVDGKVIRKPISFLYNQNFFPAPPYAYYNIYKTGALFRVNKKVSGEAGWTKNEFKYAGQIDNNINNFRIAMKYTPVQQFLLRGQYSYTEVNDLSKQLNTGILDYKSHHGVAADLVWRTGDHTELLFQYGVSGYMTSNTLFSLSPYGDSFSVLDTQDFIRIAFQGKF